MRGAEPLRGIGDHRAVAALIEAYVTASQPARPTRALAPAEPAPVDPNRAAAALIPNEFELLSRQPRAGTAMPVPGDCIAISSGSRLAQTAPAIDAQTYCLR
jgi:hypothetical protein